MSATTIALALVLGFSAGALSGLFGVGGGVLFVPTLALVVGLSQLDAQATSLAAMIPVVVFGSWQQHKAGNVRWKAGLAVGLASVIGVLGGAALATSLDDELLRNLFAVFLLFVAGQLLWSTRPVDPLHPSFRADNVQMVSHRVVQAAVVVLAVLALGSAAAAQSPPSSRPRRSAFVFCSRADRPLVGLRRGAPARQRHPGRLELRGRGDRDRLDRDGRPRDVGPGGSTAVGSASVRSVSLFGGEVTVDGVFVKASAHASGTGANGDLSASSLSNLVVLGESVRAGPNGRVPLGDWGYAVTLERAVVRSSGVRSATGASSPVCTSC